VRNHAVVLNRSGLDMHPTKYSRNLNVGEEPYCILDRLIFIVHQDDKFFPSAGKKLLTIKSEKA
jgi:hypothetical protein